MSGSLRKETVTGLSLRHCDSCNEVYSDSGVDLVSTGSFIEDGPDEIWCKHCAENWQDHQSKYYEEPDVSEATEWSDFDQDC